MKLKDLADAQIIVEKRPASKLGLSRDLSIRILAYSYTGLYLYICLYWSVLAALAETVLI
jgi:hypothetical protein